MSDESVELAQNFINGFISLLKKDPSTAHTTLVSTYISCHAMMEAEERVYCTAALLRALTDINNERFEDGADFLSFLKEKRLIDPEEL